MAKAGVKQGQPLRIAVEGVIGVGKTTLARAIAERIGAVLLGEDELSNPFLSLFYQKPARYALACQLWFLEARLRQYAGNIPVGVPVVADHSLVKEPLFATVNLSGDELELYQRLYNRLAPQAAFKPDVTIFLTASLAEVRERIRKRGRRIEDVIDTNYLEQLVDAYSAWFDMDHARDRIVVVNADGDGIAQDPEAVGRLVEACMVAPHGISYCNPEG